MNTKVDRLQKSVLLFLLSFLYLHPFVNAQTTFPPLSFSQIGSAQNVNADNSTYYGGSGDEEIRDLEVHTDGSIFFVGKTSSDDFGKIATADAHQFLLAGSLSDAFLVRMDETGKLRLWGTYFGEMGADEGNALALDETGVYIIGTIERGDSKDIFVMKFDHDGRTAWDTPYYYASLQDDHGIDIAVDGNSVYGIGDISGSTDSGVFFKLDKTTGAEQKVNLLQHIDEQNAFNASAIHISDHGAIYFTGIVHEDLTFSVGGKKAEAGVTLIKSDTNLTIDWASSINGLNTGELNTQFVATQGNQLVFAAAKGRTNRNDINIYNIDQNSGTAKLIVDEFGGNVDDLIRDIQLDQDGNIIIIGSTSSSTDIVDANNGLYQSVFGGEEDAFIAKFKKDGTRLWSTYFGSTASDNGLSLVSNPKGVIYIAGMARSSINIATPDSYDPSYNGANDGFFALFNDFMMVKHPDDLRVGLGESASFNAFATGTVPQDEVEYQWYKKNENTGLWELISGETNENFSISNVQMEDEGEYLCLAYSPTVDGIVYSKVAKLEVAKLDCKPLICLGESNHFKALDLSTETGISNVQYTWNATPAITAGIPTGVNNNEIDVVATYAGVYTYEVLISYEENGEAKSMTLMAEVEVKPVVHLDTNGLKNTLCSEEEMGMQLSAIYQYDIDDNDPKSQKNPANWLKDTERAFNVKWEVSPNTNITGTKNGEIRNTRNLDTSRNSINDLLTNSTNTDQVVTYTFDIEHVDTVDVALAGWCGSSTTVDVTVWALPEVVAGTAMSICQGDEKVLLQGYMPSNAVWTGTGVVEDGGQYYFDASVAGIGTHTLTLKATSTNGCINTDTREVTVYALPSVSVQPQNVEICNGELASVLLSASHAETTFKITPTAEGDLSGFNGGEFTTTDGTFNFQQSLNNASTEVRKVSYNIIPITNGCEGSAQTLEISVSPTPTLNPVSVSELCHGIETIIPLTGSTNTTFYWEIVSDNNNISGQANGSSLSQWTLNLTNLTNQIQMISYKIYPMVNGCKGVEQLVNVTVQPSIDFSLSAIDAEICSGRNSSLNFNTSVAGVNANFTWRILNKGAHIEIGTESGFINDGSTSGVLFDQIVTNTGSTSESFTVEVVMRTTECLGETKTYDITVHPFPKAEINESSNSVEICGGSSHVIAAKVITGATYQWFLNGTAIAGANLSSYEAFNAGLYTVEVSLNGCSSISDPFEVGYKTTNQAEIIGLTESAYCFGEVIDQTLSSAVDATAYEWFKDGLKIGTTKEINVTEAGTYTLIITDETNCGSLPDSVTITQNEEPAVEIYGFTTDDELKFCIGETVHTVLTANAPEAVSYQWQILDTVTLAFNHISGATNSTYTVTTFGEYRVLIETAIGCEGVSSSARITTYDEVLANAGEDVEVCQKESISIGTSSAVPDHYSYYWTAITANAPTLSSIDTHAPNLTPSDIIHTPGIYEYQLEVTDTNTGCKAIDVVAVRVKAKPKVEIIADGETAWCGGDTIQVTLTSKVNNLAQTGAVTYTWTDKDGNFISSEQSIDVNAVGEYYLEVNSIEGCSEVVSQIISQTALVDPIILMDDTEIIYKEICMGEGVKLSVKDYNPAITYEWRDEAETILGTGEQITISTSQKVHLVARPNIRCEEYSKTVEVRVKPLPIAAITTTDPTDFCLGDAINIELRSAHTTMDAYQWYKDGLEIVGATNINLAVTEEGTYTLVVQEDGCTSLVSEDITIQRHPFPTAGITADQLSFCEGSSISSTLTAVTDIGTTYNWQKKDASGLFVDLGVSTNTHIASDTGTYRVEITSVYGCKTASEEKQVKYTSLSDLELSIQHGAEVICEDDFVILEIPNDPSFSFAWYKDGVLIADETTTQLTVTNSGAYHAIATQKGGLTSCSTTSKTINITVEPLPTLHIIPVSEICQLSELQMEVNYSPNEGSAGTIELAEWHGEDISESGLFIPSKGDTTYTLTFHYRFKYTGALASCEQTASIDVKVNSKPEIDLSSVPTSFCNTSFEIGLDDFGTYTHVAGTGIWTGLGVKNNKLNPAEAVIENSGLTGQFTLTYTFTDDKGCINSVDHLVTISDASTVTAGTSQEMCINDIDLVMQGAEPANGTWTLATVEGASISTDGIFTPTRVGTFVVNYTHGSGSCEVTAQKEIIVHDIPKNNAGYDLEVCLLDSAFELAGINGSISIVENTERWEGHGILDATTGLFSAADAGIGRHQITFKSIDATTACANVDTLEIMVHPVPTPSFALATDGAYCMNSEIVFKNTTPELPGYNLSYRWDFGDGHGDTQKDGVHTYDQTYDEIEVTLYVSTNQGCEIALTQKITVVETPTVLFSMSHDITTCTPITVFFDNESDGYALNYHWDFGNGRSSTEENPDPITYFNPSPNDTTYYITLTVNNICGLQQYKDSIIVEALPVVDFMMNKDTVCADETLELLNMTLGKADKFEWNFGDETPLYETTSKDLIYHAFENESDTLLVRTITLMAYNDCGIEAISKNVVIRPKEMLAFFNISTVKGCEGTEVIVTSNQTGTNDIEWDFGDGITQEGGISATHIYDSAGIYEITLKVSNGCHSDTYTQSIEILESPTLSFEVEGSICLGNSITFKNTSFTTGDYHWDFGDGTTYTGEHPPAKVYDRKGTYIVELTLVSSSNGCTGSFKQEVEVLEMPTITFDLPTIICSQDEVTLIADVPDAVAWKWTLDDGRTFIGDTVQVVFNISQNITLTVENSLGCIVSTSKAAHVTTTPIPEGHIPNLVQMSTEDSKEICADPITGTLLYWMKDGVNLTAQGESCVLIEEGGDYVLVAEHLTTGCVFTDTMQVVSYEVHLPQEQYFCDTDEESTICPIYEPSDTNAGDFQFKWTDRNTGKEVFTECLSVHGLSIGLQSWDLEITDLNGYKSYGNTEFFVIAEPYVNLEDQEVCANSDSVLLTAESLSHNVWTSYRWWNITTPDEILGEEATLVVHNNGRYVVEVNDIRSGCSVLDTTRVTMHPVPKFEILGYDGTLCEDSDTLYINEKDLTGYHLEWSGTASFQGDKNGKFIVVDKTGLYTLTVTDLNNPFLCSTSEEVDVITGNIPIVSLNDTLVCSAEAPIELIAKDPVHGPNMRYNWYDLGADNDTPISTEGIYYATQPGVYVVEVINSLTGCSNYDTARVEFDWNPDFNILGYDKPTCEETVRLYLDRVPSDQVSVIWYKNEVLWKENVYEAIVEESGSYKVIMRDLTKPTACQSEEVMNVWLNDKPEVTVEDIEVCEEGPTTLRASLATVGEDRYAFHWYDLYDTTTKLHTGIQFEAPKTSYYIVEVEDLIAECIATRDTAFAQLNPQPSFKIGGYDEPTCADSIELVIEDRSLTGLKVEWYFNKAKYAEGSASSWATTTGVYEVILTDTTKNTNCTYSQALHIKINDFPEVKILPDVDTLNVCYGSTFDLNVGVNRTATIEWNTGQVSSLIQNKAHESAWYEVTITDKNGCTASDQIYVQVSPIDFTLPEVIGTCGKKEPAQVCIEDSFTKYEWKNAIGTLISQTNCLETYEIGVYTLTVYNDQGCSSTKKVEVIEANGGDLELLSFPSLCDGDEYTTIEVTPGFAAYYWNGEELSSGPRFIAYELGTYEVMAVSESGCTQTLQVDVIDCCGPQIDIDDFNKGKPIVFSPFNSLGKNDVFYLNYKHIDMDQFEMRIFSRWGEQVFYTTDPHKAWDGRINGKEAPSDVYQVIINFVGCENQEEVKKSEILQLFLSK